MMTGEVDEPGECLEANKDLLATLSPEIRETLALLNKPLKSLPKKWVIFENHIYDIEGYLASESHPGGNLILEQFLCQDITEQFEAIGHSASARQLLMSFAPKEESPSDVPCDDPSQNPSPPPMVPSGGISLLDLQSPLLAQIFNLSKRDYALLTSDYSCSPTIYTLFKNPVLETLSRTVWWVIPLIWIPCALLIGSAAHHYYKTSYSESLVCCLTGVLFWTFFEYIIHRFIFHFPEEALVDVRLVRVLHFLIHGIHHTLPMDPLRLVVPPVLFIILATPLYSLSLLILPHRFVHTVLPGVLIGYVAYDMIHYSTHHGSITDRHQILNSLKAYHMKHHFKNPHLGFGVSSPLWDLIFQTKL